MRCRSVSDATTVMPAKLNLHDQNLVFHYTRVVLEGSVSDIHTLTMKKVVLMDFPRDDRTDSPECQHLRNPQGQPSQQVEDK